MKKFSEQTVGSTAAVVVGVLRIKGLARVLAGLLFCALLCNSAPTFGATLPATYSLTLAWNPSTSPGVVSYNVYYGTSSGNYSSNVTAGNATALTIPGLLSGVTYYFATTAVDANGLESGYSSEISYPQTLPTARLQITALTGGRFMLTVNGSAGHTNNIEATQDLKTWTPIGTVIVGAGGSVNFTDANAVNYSKRFYRTREIP